MAAEPPANNSRSATARDWVSTITGLAVLLAFALLINYLLTQTAASDIVWARLTYLLSGVEALVFAAAGFLFGREVHRERAERAETDAAAAKTEARAAEQTAAQARESLVKADEAVKAIVNQIEVKRAGQQAKIPRYAALGAPQAAQATQEDFEELAAFAAKYARS